MLLPMWERLFVRGNPGFLQGVQITGEALVGGIKIRAAEDQADLPVAQGSQFLDGLAGGMNVVNDDGTDLALEGLDQAVHQQDRDPGGQRGLQVAFRRSAGLRSFRCF